VNTRQVFIVVLVLVPIVLLVLVLVLVLVLMFIYLRFGTQPAELATLSGEKTDRTC
jgi:hypothetical protein